MSKEYYAVIRWTTEDIHSHRRDQELPSWTEEQAEDWLEDNERGIREQTISSGWDYFDYIMEDD